MPPSDAQRVEQDLLGRVALPLDAYFGIHTERARANFRLSGTSVGDLPALVSAIAAVKLAAARANRDCGELGAPVFEAIERACLELLEGGLRDQFPIDAVQGGAGTSTNMNANEVIANRALELLGHARGAYEHCHPNDHVNRSQSTNDVYPTAVKAAILSGQGALKTELRDLVLALREQARRHREVVKLGRTQLQDAVSMTVGEEFEAWAESLNGERASLRFGAERLLDVNLGGTVVGTGLGAPPGYAARAVTHLATILGQPFRLASHLVASTSDSGAFVAYSAALQGVALKLGKVCDDLRLLSSGPSAGLNELRLPPVQAGSSMIPGKVNPVIPEAVNQACFRVAGLHSTVALAAGAGQLQLNAMLPVIAVSTLEAQSLLTNAAASLATRCVGGIEVNSDVVRAHAREASEEITALASTIGYSAASAIAGEARASGRRVAEVMRES